MERGHVFVLESFSEINITGGSTVLRMENLNLLLGMLFKKNSQTYQLGCVKFYSRAFHNYIGIYISLYNLTRSTL